MLPPSVLLKSKMNTLRKSLATLILTACLFLSLQLTGAIVHDPTAELSFITKEKQYYIVGHWPSLAVVNNSVIHVSDTGTKQLQYDVFTINPVGSINVVSLGNSFSEESKYIYSPYVVVHEASNTIIEVHQDDQSHLYYRLGKLSGAIINWNTTEGILYAGGGRHPIVAVTKSGTVISVYEDSSSNSNLYYKLGKLNVTSEMITWYTPVLYSSGDGQYYTPRVSISQNGTVVVAHIATLGKDNSLYYRTGKIDDTAKEINWFIQDTKIESCSSDNHQCSNIDIVIDPFGVIVSVYNKKLSTVSDLYYRTGELHNYAIEWSDPIHLSSGITPALTFLPGYNRLYVMCNDSPDGNTLLLSTLAFGVEFVNISYGNPTSIDSIPFAIQVTEFHNNGPVTLTQTWILEQQYTCTNTYNWESNVHLGISVTSKVKFFGAGVTQNVDASIDMTVGQSSAVGNVFQWTAKETISIPPNTGLVTYTATVYRTPWSIPYTATFKRGSSTWTETGTVEVTHGAITAKITSK